MKKARVNGVELAYRDEGAGAPLVFLHAFPLNQTMWDGQVTAFAGRRRVVTFDWRGFGASSAGGGISGMDVLADDLAGLLDELQIGRAAICGLSMGGYAAFAFARRRADRVEALILADTRPTPDTEEGKQGRRDAAELVRQSGPAAIAERMLPKLLGPTTRRDRPQVLSQVRAMIEANRPEGIAQASLGMAEREDATPLLGQLSCPTLVIVGNEDQLTPPSDSEKMSRLIPGARLAVIPGAGHLSNLEQPEVFNRHLAEFLGTEHG